MTLSQWWMMSACAFGGIAAPWLRGMAAHVRKAGGPGGCCPGVLLAGVMNDDGALAFCVCQVGRSVEFCCFQDPFSLALACVAFTFAQ